MWSVPYKSAKQQKSKPCVITVIMWFWLFYLMKFVALFTIRLEHGCYSCNWALILIWQSLSSYSYCFKKLNFKKVCNINSNVLYDNWWDVLFTICLYKSSIFIVCCTCIIHCKLYLCQYPNVFNIHTYLQVFWINYLIKKLFVWLCQFLWKFKLCHGC